MSTDKNKIVQNYCLEQFRFSHPDESQVWTAKHKILKKDFTLRRFKYRSQSQTQKVMIPDKQEWDYQNMMRQTYLLKRLNAQYIPKCHKMIKTSNNIYLVYDQFPSSNLRQHLAKNPPNRKQKLEIMESIAKTLQTLHSKNIILLALSWENIYPREKNEIFFGDWSIARLSESQHKIDATFLKNKYPFIAPELLTVGTFSTSSDIYSIGKIFQKIYSAGFLQSPSIVDNKLLQMIALMKRDQQNQRPSLTEIIKTIQNCNCSKSSSPKSNPSQKSISKIVSMASIPFLKVKHSMSSPEDVKTHEIMSVKKYSQAIDESTTVRIISSANDISENASTTNKTEKKSISNKKHEKSYYFQINTTRSQSQNSERGSQSKDHIYQIERAAKSANKKRNFVYFLANLSEYIIRIGVCPELGYIILKYAKLTLKSTLQQWNADMWDTEASKQFADILIAQQQKLQMILNILKGNFKKFEKDEVLKRELMESNSISERYLRQKIIQFSQEMVIYCDNYLKDKNHLNEMTEALFNTYMVLKKIQQGSYEKFWDRIYNRESAFLDNQKYLIDERKIGLRSLQSKIAEILKGL